MRIRTRRTFGKPIFLGKTGLGLSYFYYEPNSEQCLDEVHKGPPFKHGGPLTIAKISYNHTTSSNVHLVGIGSPRRTYDGRFCVSTWQGSFPAGTSPNGPPIPSSAAFKAVHDGFSPTAWKKFRPGNPTAQLGQAVGELHQIPTIPLIFQRGLANKFRNLRDRGLLLKKAGSEYLNLQFGWFPFVKDLRDAVKTQQSIQTRLDQLRRDNGKKVRRRGSVSSSSTQSSTVGNVNLYPILTNEFYPNSSVPFEAGSSVTTTTDSHWFSARFRYFIPNIDSPDWESKAKRILFGTTLTPSLVWELTPWSWLIDWSTNVGDVLSNMSANAAENLVAEYAYLMSTRTFEETIMGRGVMQSVFPITQYFPISAEVTRKTEFKLRSVANPYGFGLTYAGLNTRQMLILAALGLSRH